MDGIKEMCQKKLLADNEKIIYLIISGCGGVMFMKHFYSMIGKTDTRLIDRLIDNGIIKVKQIGRNKVIIAKHTAYRHFGLSTKSPRLTSKHLLHSALLCEMLIHTYFDNTEKMVKILQQGNFCYYAVENSLNFLNRVYCFMNGKSADTSTLKLYLDELKEKTEFLKSSTKGRKDTLKKTACQTTDLLILRNNNIYVHYADYTENTLQIHLAIFQYQNNTEKLIRNIKKSLEAVSSMMYGIPTRVIIDVYSLNEKSEFLQKKVFNSFPDENIRFHWYNVKNRLFSGIDVEKWL